MDDFEAFAKTALGTDDPERISALKEAIKACSGAEDDGEYDEEEEEPKSSPAMGKEMMSGKGKGLAALFGK